MKSLKEIPQKQILLMIAESVNTTMPLFDCFHSVKPEIELLLQHCTMCVWKYVEKQGPRGGGGERESLKLKIEADCLLLNESSESRRNDKSAKSIQSSLFLATNTQTNTQTQLAQLIHFQIETFCAFHFMMNTSISNWSSNIDCFMFICHQKFKLVVMVGYDCYG